MIINDMVSVMGNLAKSINFYSDIGRGLVAMNADLRNRHNILSGEETDEEIEMIDALTSHLNMTIDKDVIFLHMYYERQLKSLLREAASLSSLEYEMVWAGIVNLPEKDGAAIKEVCDTHLIEIPAIIPTYTGFPC